MPGANPLPFEALSFWQISFWRLGIGALMLHMEHKRKIFTTSKCTMTPSAQLRTVSLALAPICLDFRHTAVKVKFSHRCVDRRWLGRGSEGGRHPPTQN